MFFSALVLLIIGFPVAFVFGATAVVFSVIFPEIGIEVFNFLPFRIYGIMQNFTLMAVPLFIFMGLILEKSDLARRLLESMGKLFGRINGGLAISVVLVGAILAASTGIVGASVVMMSVIALPIMVKHSYDRSLAAGAIAASGTLGQLIPPSVVLIILGDVMSISVGDLFKAAILPGVLLISLYLIYIVFVSWKNPHIAPSMIDETEDRKAVYKEAIYAIIPPLLLILSVLGSIFFGIASPTESAAVGVFGALILSSMNRKISVTMVRDSALQTVKLTGMIFMILIGATAFSLVFNELGGSEIILDFFSQEHFSKWVFIILSMIVIFILGFFIDFVEIAFIVVPILLPVVEELAINPLWYAVLVAMNLQASFLTPPFGFALFYLKGAANKLVTTMQIYKGVIPFIFLQLLALAIIMLFPQIVTILL